MKWTAVGLGLGLAGAFAAARVMKALLFAVDPVDPPTFAATGLIVCVVAYLACYLPAGRAALSPVNGSATFTSDDLQGLRLSDRVDTSLLILNTRASARVR